MIESGFKSRAGNNGARTVAYFNPKQNTFQIFFNFFSPVSYGIFNADAKIFSI